MISKIRLKLTVVMLLSMLTAWAEHDSAVKVICVGASITEGHGTVCPPTDAFPAKLGEFLGEGYAVTNFGAGGTTMLKNGNYPYWEKGPLDKALASAPDIVIIDLGGNDSKAMNRPYMDEFVSDACDMVSRFKSLPSSPRVILLTPIVSFVKDSNDIWDECIVNDVAPRVVEAAIRSGVEVIDMHPVLDCYPELMPDGIHPDNIGAKMMAKYIYDYLRKHPNKPTSPGKK